jgi:alanyl-tRNA synthetase
MLTVIISKDLVEKGLNAGKMVKESAKLIQGGGGGQPYFATAGGRNKDGLREAVDKILELSEI